MWNYFRAISLSQDFPQSGGNTPLSRAFTVHLRTRNGVQGWRKAAGEQSAGKRKMEVPKPIRPGDFYHERAREMLKRAEQAKTDDARASFLVLAANGENLARQIEHPSW
jgi:hypothetical protein